MTTNPILLGVNVDHVATLRQARGTDYPSPVHAAKLAAQAGADGITVHLREDRRHIQDADVIAIKQQINTKLNLEMAVTDEMITFAKEVRPPCVCLVPEKREELTTEGGLDVEGNFQTVAKACKELADADIEVSLFIDADLDQIKAASEAGALVVEIHTGHYADATTLQARDNELARIKAAVQYGVSLGLQINAGHGLTVANVASIAAIPEIVELNIGHALIADSIYVGLPEAVKAMKRAMKEAR